MTNDSRQRMKSLETFQLVPKSGDGGSGVVEINLIHVRPESSRHRPETRLRLWVSGKGLHLDFSVKDRFVVARERGLNGPVCRDSCVEAFLQPPGANSYINFEFNALGNLHASHIRDPARRPGGFADYRLLSPAECSWIETRGGLDAPTAQEIETELDWSLGVTISWELFAGVFPGFSPNGEWRGNFYKCADESSHPHWISWAPVPELNFHCPEAFAPFGVSGV